MTNLFYEGGPGEKNKKKEPSGEKKNGGGGRSEFLSKFSRWEKMWKREI